MKYVNLDIKAPDPDDPAGRFEAILSAPTLDRDLEIIDARAFDPLPAHLAIDIDHGMSTQTTVGSGTPFYEGDILKFRGTFSTLPIAQGVRTLVTEGHVRHMSVAFMNAQRTTDDQGRVHITTAELLNAAIVPIPSNREAAILSARSWRDRTNASTGLDVAVKALVELAEAELAQLDHLPRPSARPPTSAMAALRDAQAFLRNCSPRSY